MAKSNSFNKRDLEKKKELKKQEKLKRKEERKANAGSGSFEDMIAYVDENGVIPVPLLTLKTNRKLILKTLLFLLQRKRMW